MRHECTNMTRLLVIQTILFLPILTELIYLKRFDMHFYWDTFESMLGADYELDIWQSKVD